MTRHISGDDAAELLATYREAMQSNPVYNKSPAQVESWLQSNVTDLGTAKSALVLIGGVLALHDAVIVALAKRVSRLERG